MREARALRQFNRLWLARVVMQVVAAVWLVSCLLGCPLRCLPLPAFSPCASCHWLQQDEACRAHEGIQSQLCYLSL